MPVALHDVLSLAGGGGGGGNEVAQKNAPLPKDKNTTFSTTTKEKSTLVQKKEEASSTSITHGKDEPRTDVPMLDIRSNKDTFDLREEILNGLNVPEGKQKVLPTMLLYDSAGLKEFERITYVDEYYLTNTEIQLLEKYAGNIAERIEDGGIVVELGSGYVIAI